MELNDKLPLARFVFDKRYIRADGTVHHKLFIPQESHPLSTFDTNNMNREAVCSHGRSYADNHTTTPKRIHKGYAILAYSVYLKHNLTGVYDNSPPRHVSINIPHLEEKKREIGMTLAGEVNDCYRCE